MNRLYFDACTIIYGVEASAPLRDRVVERIAALLDTDGIAVTSRLSLLECQAKPLRKGRADPVSQSVPMRLSLCLVAAVLALAPASRARACSPNPCSPSVAAPPMGSTIPANAPALFFDPGFDSGHRMAAASDVALLDGTGSAVPLDARVDPLLAQPGGGPYLLIPRAPLDPSANYLLRFPPGCIGFGAPSDGGLALVDRRFTTSDAVPLPKTAGTLAIAQREQAITVNTGRGSCVFNILASTAKLDFRAADELKPWLPLARFTTSVDGKVWRGSAYGADPAANQAFDGIGLAVYGRVTQIYAGCPPLDPLNDNGLSLGPHHVELQVHIAGALSDPPPLPIDVTLTCSELPSSVDAALPDAGGDIAVPGSGCGCSLGSGVPSMATPSVAVALAVGLLVARLRARRRRLHCAQTNSMRGAWAGLCCLTAFGASSCLRSPSCGAGAPDCGAPKDGGGPLSLADYSLALARAECHLRVRCGWDPPAAEADCVTEILTAAPGGHFSDDDAVAGGRATFDAAAAARCLAAYNTLQSCMGGTVESYAFRAACQPPFHGLVLEGGACYQAFECADGYCDGNGPGCEGRCKAWPLGGSCQCRPGEWCAGIERGCLPLGALGADCGGDEQCTPRLACQYHYTQTGPKGQCGAPIQAGQPCLAISECGAGLYCDDTSHTCAPIAREGEPCNGAIGCVIGFVCKDQVCAQPSEAGDPTARIGLPCTPGACGNGGTLYCDDGATGICRPGIGVGKPCTPPTTGGDNPCVSGACDPVARVCAAPCA